MAIGQRLLKKQDGRTARALQLWVRTCTCCDNYYKATSRAHNGVCEPCQAKNKIIARKKMMKTLKAKGLKIWKKM